ncbi:MAG: TatD family hydrolase, partial [Myxococcaceae bacterium]
AAADDAAALSFLRQRRSVLELPLVDTHCHLDASRFRHDLDAVLARAWEAGLCGIVVPGVEPEEWRPLLELASRDARIKPGLGIHPQALPSLPEDTDDASLELLDALLSEGKAIAVGECGLDGPSAAGAPMERQVRVLRRHFELSRKHGLPLLVHVYRAHPAMVEFLKNEPLPEAGVVLHSYSGGPDLAKFYAGRGCYFSFAGPVSWPEARKPIAALQAVPLDRLMLETDAPDQAPWPHRGERSEPAWLPHIAEAVAKTLDLPVEALAHTTTETARRFFRYPFPADSGAHPRSE